MAASGRSPSPRGRLGEGLETASRGEQPRPGRPRRTRPTRRSCGPILWRREGLGPPRVLAKSLTAADRVLSRALSGPRTAAGWRSVIVPLAYNRAEGAGVLRAVGGGVGEEVGEVKRPCRPPRRSPPRGRRAASRPAARVALAPPSPAILRRPRSLASRGRRG